MGHQEVHKVKDSFSQREREVIESHFGLVLRTEALQPEPSRLAALYLSLQFRGPSFWYNLGIQQEAKARLDCQNDHNEVAQILVI